MGLVQISSVSDDLVEELAGSPRYVIDYKGGSGEREWKVHESVLDNFILEKLPVQHGLRDDPTVGEPFPKRPWLRAYTAEVRPFTDDRPSPGEGENPSRYVYWRVLVKYKPGEQQSNINPITPANQDDGRDNEDEWVHHNLSIGGEFVTLPDHSVIFENDANPVEAVNAGKIICLIEHQIRLENVPYPPWSAIAANVGKVSNGGTLLFLGAEAEWHRGKFGRSEWDLEYKFSEKTGGLTWNHFMHPILGEFQILYKVSGGLIYDYGNFAPLFVGIYGANTKVSSPLRQL